MEPIEIVTAVASPIAVVRRRVSWSELPALVPSMLDAVYAATSAPGRQGGHNVIVYRATDRDGADVECGVQVRSPIVDRGAVQASVLPAGRAATTTHLGSYAQLGTTYDALFAWLRAHGETPAGVNWEVYGDPPTPDALVVPTQVFVLLA